MTNARSHRLWADFFEQHYRSGPGRNQVVVVPTVGTQASRPGVPNPPAPPSTRARVAPLAIWLTSRWGSIHTQGALYGRLQSLNWAPNIGSRFFRVSLGVLETATRPRGVIGGENFFAECVTAYVRSLGQLNVPFMRYIFAGGYGGGIGERTVIRPLNSGERTAFQNKVSIWGTTNGSPGPSPGPGLPPNGLPYGVPHTPINGIGNHKDRIIAIYRIVQDISSGGSFAHNSRSRTAGIVETTSGGPPPYLFRWF